MEPTKRLFNGAAELGVVDCKYDGHLHGFGRYEPDIGGQDILWSTPVREKGDAERIALCVNAHERLVATNDALVESSEQAWSFLVNLEAGGYNVPHGLTKKLRAAIALARGDA